MPRFAKQSFFVTGTDTDVGKSIISAALLLGSHSHSLDTFYWKPVQTGTPDSDSSIVARLSGLTHNVIPSRFIYGPPRAPDQAARLSSQVAPTVAALKLSLEQCQANTKGDLIIEGAGGLLVPLNEHNETWVDFLRETSLNIILVARSGLGTINHTALSLSHLEARGMYVHAVILNGPKDQDNAASLKRMFPHVDFIQFPEVNLDGSDTYRASAHQLARDVYGSGHQSDGFDHSNDIASLDQQFIWHPYTQHAFGEEHLVIERASGVWLYTAEGERLLDATGSWWVNTIGHGRPEIANAIAKQQQQIDQVLFAGLTHEPAAKLAAKVISTTNHDFAKVYFSDNGSSAIEIAIKMAYQSFTNRGQNERRKFLALKGGYHGDTIGTMAVGGGDGFDDPYAPLLFKCEKLTPVLTHHSRFAMQDRKTAREQLARHLADHHHEYAALVVEPLVQGAGGMLIQDEEWLRDLCQQVRRYGIPVVFDEVFTGMGRLGHWFAYQKLGFTPDILCLAKGLTGNSAPLALTLTSAEIFAAFLDQSKSKALLHGHSFTGNPITCSAALATFEIYEKESLVARAAQMEQTYLSWIASNAKQLNFENPRCLGGILAGEMPGSKTGGYFSRQSNRDFYRRARNCQLWLRPLGNTLYLTPPLSITSAELEDGLSSFEKLLTELAAQSPSK